MTTTIDKFQDAYATQTLAVYEPLILRWVSGWSILTASSTMAWRGQKARYYSTNGVLATAHALNTSKFVPRLPHEPNFGTIDPVPEVEIEAISKDGKPFALNQVKKIKMDGFPNAIAYNGNVYPQGVDSISFKDASTIGSSGNTNGFLSFFRSGFSKARQTAKLNVAAVSTPMAMSKRTGMVEADFDYHSHRNLLYKDLVGAAIDAVNNNKDLMQQIQAVLANHNGLQIFDFLPAVNIEEALSPIGVAHYYRQLYFNLDEGFGPIEHCFTVAPKETLEVVVTSTRRQIHEEVVEIGSEAISEQAIEERNMEEVSDKVSSMLQRDMSASMSINGSYSTPVYQLGASASASMNVSSQRSREAATKRLKDVTKRASERITKSYSIKTRDFEELTDSTMTRRVISNENDAPVNYALRRVLRRVRVKVQDLGPRAVWQLYLSNPGRNLAIGRFVHFREATNITTPDVPPGVPPRPQGGTDTGSTSSAMQWSSTHNTWYVTVKIQTTADRKITAVSIDSLTDLESNSKDDYAPSAKNTLQWDVNWDETTNTFSANIAIVEGDSMSITVGYTYSWEPSQTVLDEWEDKRKQAVAALEEQAMIEQFEKDKQLITEKSKIRPRPANELRREERYEVMNRMVSHLFAQGDDPSEPTPLEIESFHRYFDIEAMFIYTHPSWWKPRYTPVGVVDGRPAYEITSESEPAKLGSSLGWKIQLDGDNRRNEFINSPWLRICLPMKPGKEEEAIRWLARHIEGEVGYDLNAGPLKKLLDDLKAERDKEDSIGLDGADFVTVDSNVGAPDGAVSPENVYPVIDEFDVTLPTEGFIYDEVLVKDEGAADDA